MPKRSAFNFAPTGSPQIAFLKAAMIGFFSQTGKGALDRGLVRSFIYWAAPAWIFYFYMVFIIVIDVLIVLLDPEKSVWFPPEVLFLLVIFWALVTSAFIYYQFKWSLTENQFRLFPEELAVLPAQVRYALVLATDLPSLLRRADFVKVIGFVITAAFGIYLALVAAFFTIFYSP